MTPRLALPLMAAFACAASAAPVQVELRLIDAQGSQQAIGHVTLSDTPYGLLLEPALTALPPGVHGFHVHEQASCAPAQVGGKTVPGGGAGGHLDPLGSGRHGAPWGDGHLGDLPGLVVEAGGTAGYPLLAPRLRLALVLGGSLMVHVGGDNHADHPMAMGGGGPRMACGVIPAQQAASDGAVARPSSLHSLAWPLKPPPPLDNTAR